MKNKIYSSESQENSLCTNGKICILEYGSVVWSPGDKDSIPSIENVQRKATNFITCNPHITQPGYIDYQRRLTMCNLLPLSYRRELADIIFFCRSYNNDIAFNTTKHVAFNNRPTWGSHMTANPSTHSNCAQNQNDYCGPFLPYKNSQTMELHPISFQAEHQTTEKQPGHKTTPDPDVQK